MKSKFGREIGLLMLPVLIVGGVAWLGAGSGRALLPAFLKTNPLAAGPIRVEFSPLQAVPVTPFDVAEGYEWAVTTTIESRGEWNMPPGWKVTGGSTGVPSRFDLVYRQKIIGKPRRVNAENARSLL